MLLHFFLIRNDSTSWVLVDHRILKLIPGAKFNHPVCYCFHLKTPNENM